MNSVGTDKYPYLPNQVLSDGHAPWHGQNTLRDSRAESSYWAEGSSQQHRRAVMDYCRPYNSTSIDCLIMNIASVLLIRVHSPHSSCVSVEFPVLTRERSDGGFSNSRRPPLRWSRDRKSYLAWTELLGVNSEDNVARCGEKSDSK